MQGLPGDIIRRHIVLVCPQSHRVFVIAVYLNSEYEFTA